MASLATSGALAASAAAPLALRTFDSPGQSITRPSVAGPTLLGGGLIGLGMAVDRGMLATPIGSRRGFSSLAMMSGTVMLGGAIGNALVPSTQTSLALPF